MKIRSFVFVESVVDNQDNSSMTLSGAAFLLLAQAMPCAAKKSFDAQIMGVDNYHSLIMMACVDG